MDTLTYLIALIIGGPFALIKIVLFAFAAVFG